MDFIYSTYSPPLASNASLASALYTTPAPNTSAPTNHQQLLLTEDVESTYLSLLIILSALAVPAHLLVMWMAVFQVIYGWKLRRNREIRLLLVFRPSSALLEPEFSLAKPEFRLVATSYGRVEPNFPLVGPVLSRLSLISPWWAQFCLG